MTDIINVTPSTPDTIVVSTPANNTTVLTVGVGQGGAVGQAGPTGPSGASGVIDVSLPITNSGTSTAANIGIDQTALSITSAQISDKASTLITGIVGGGFTKHGDVTIQGNSGIDVVSDPYTSQITVRGQGVKGSANGVASLDNDAKVPANQLPAIAITDTFVVTDKSDLTSLTAETGDVGIVTSESKSYILKGSSPTVLENWEWLRTPAVGVTSVSTGTGLSGGPITSTGTISIDSTVATLSDSQTLTNKSISGSSNTLTNIPAGNLTGTVAVGNGGTGQTTIPLATIWNALTAYAVGDVVTYQTGYYVRRVAGTTSTAPSGDTTNWAARSASGSNLGATGSTPTNLVAYNQSSAITALGMAIGTPPQTIPSTGLTVSNGSVSVSGSGSVTVSGSGSVSVSGIGEVNTVGSSGAIRTGVGGIVMPSGTLNVTGSGNITQSGSGQVLINSSSTTNVPLVIAPTGNVTLPITFLSSTTPNTTFTYSGSTTGLVVGQTVTISGFPSNNGSYSLVSFGSGYLTLLTGSGPSSGSGTLSSVSTTANLTEWRTGSPTNTVRASVGYDGTITTLGNLLGNTIVASGAISSATNITASGYVAGSQFNGSGAGLTNYTVPTQALASTTGGGSNVVTDVSPSITYGSTTVTGITGTGTNFVTSISPTISTSIVTGTSFTFAAAASTLTIGSLAANAAMTHSYSSGTVGTTFTKTVNISTGTISGTTANQTINIGTGANSATSGSTNINIGTGAMSGGALGTVTIGSTSANSKVVIVNPLNAPDVQSGTTYTVPVNNPTPNVVLTSATQVTLTLPTSVAGKEIRVLCQGAGGVISASSNVYPKTSRTLGNAILAAAGSAILVGDGTNWQIMV